MEAALANEIVVSVVPVVERIDPDDSSATHVVPSPLLSMMRQQSGCPLVHERKLSWKGLSTVISAVAHSVEKGSVAPYMVCPSASFMYALTPYSTPGRRSVTVRDGDVLMFSTLAELLYCLSSRLGSYVSVDSAQQNPASLMSAAVTFPNSALNVARVSHTSTGVRVFTVFIFVVPPLTWNVTSPLPSLMLVTGTPSGSLFQPIAAGLDVSVNSVLPDVPG